MTITISRYPRLHRPLTLLLVFAIATAPAASALAQTNAAAQAVRNRVSGLGAAEEQPEERPPEPVINAPPVAEHGSPSAAPPTESSAVRFDTTYVSPSAFAVASLRPAQILKSPLAELLPVEVATAAGMQQLGFDPADVDEVVAFWQMPPTNNGFTFKFNKPFRGSSIAPQLRPMVQLSELAGRKYLQSGHPDFPSFYGTNKQTLVVAPDAVMRPLIESLGQSRSGPLLDRLRDQPSGDDLFVAIDIVALRPLISAFLTPEIQAQVPEAAKPLLEIPNLASVATLTVNLSRPAPTSLVLHANDETAAQQLEVMVQGFVQGLQATAQAQVTPDNPYGQQLAQYQNRMLTKFTAPRNGTAVPVIYIDGKNPAQQHLIALVIAAGVGAAKAYPQIQAAFGNASTSSATPADPNAPPAAEPE